MLFAFYLLLSIQLGYLYKMKTGYTREVMQAAPPINFSLANASKNDVTFKLYKPTDLEGKSVTDKSIQMLEFDRSLPTKVLIHGWSHYSTNPWYQNYIKKYFDMKRCNIICVDWSPASTKTFLVSSANTKPIGGYIAEFLIYSEIPTEKIHIISHSLGAHAAGFAGKILIKKNKGRLERITALDPAAPTIDNKYVSEAFRLSSTDATFVDVYHTDAGFFGFTKPIGHIDFYPNFGKNQPGCPNHATDESAHHVRAIKYFQETIGTKDFKAYPANITVNGYDYKLDVNFQGIEAVIGEHTPPGTKGIFFFETNDTEPFLIKN